MNNMKNELKSSQLIMLLVMVVTGSISLTDEQIGAITNIILSSSSTVLPTQSPAESSSTTASGDTVKGLAELAQILGVSIPTASKISRSGTFDAARLHFGTKKKVWDKKLLLEIAKSNQ